MAQPNIILTGARGAGKTTIGRALASRVGRPFFELAGLVSQRTAGDAPEAGAPEVEAGLHAAVCRDLAAPADLVVALPEAVLLDSANRQALAAGGTLVYLEAEPAVLAHRLAGQNGHPLAEDVASAGERDRVAAAIPHHLDTGDLSVAAAVERVLGLAAGLPEGGHRLPVRGLLDETAARAGEGAAAPFGPILYDVLVADGLLAQAGARLQAAGVPAGRCAIVTNPTVAAHHAPALAAALRDAGFEPAIFEIPDGESHKTLATAATLYDRFAEARLARGEPVVSLGGGVAGDVAGFIAATWLRGVPFMQVPTSLLSMVDASIGGKVGVDLPAGKNLVGAFKQPALVLIDPATLASLPGAEFRSGLAEVLKSAIIAAPDLFLQLAGDGPSSLTGMIAATARVKIALVERDPYETGDRAWLNLGHTFGHALELYSGYTMRHGEAVALGLVAAAELSLALGLGERGLAESIRSVGQRLGLPVSYPFDIPQVQALMATDKKRAGRTLRFVVPRRIGDVTVVSDVAPDAVAAALRSICSS